ncbi:MAG: hypothetical protein M3123_01220 [Actinomycetota bacterium]|nr:hypothetical protein [Actinomycetota bacterium]
MPRPRLTLLLPLALALALPVAARAQRPPPILLESGAGIQRAVQESYCVSKVDETGGAGVCADTPDLRPRRLSVVRPGEVVTIALPGATIVRRDPGCHPLCEAGAAVFRLGRRKALVARFRLAGERTRWLVRLRPGAYEVEVFVGLFRTTDGRSGDTSGSLGILVSRTQPRRIVPVAPRPALTG